MGRASPPCLPWCADAACLQSECSSGLYARTSLWTCLECRGSAYSVPKAGNAEDMRMSASEGRPPPGEGEVHEGGGASDRENDNSEREREGVQPFFAQQSFKHFHIYLNNDWFNRQQNQDVQLFAGP